MSRQSADVVVVGGGPGGSVAATQLARRGLSVILLEKATFPRFHLGESLLPQSIPVLEEIGVLDRVRASFLPKYGARFHDDVRGKNERFSFDGAWSPITHAFQVPRDAFDTLLLDHARSSSVDVRERARVERIVFDGDRASGVDAVSVDGGALRIDARFVVDATGRDALTAHAGRTTARIASLDSTAIFAHFEGVSRQNGTREGDIDITLFGTAERPEWFWSIPFKDGRTSVGAVVSRAWIRAHRTAMTPCALFDAAVAESPTARSLLADATCLWSAKQATADFSYRVRDIAGPGWLAVGDAAGFIDPLFSTGAHLAMVGGKLAADAIALALATPSDEARLIDAWASRVRNASETFILAVEAFYRGPLVMLLFAEDKHAAIRRSITSLLAGDVFGDAFWLRDTRSRLKGMLGTVAP